MSGNTSSEAGKLKPKRWAFVVMVDSTDRIIEADIEDPLWQALKKNPAVEGIEVLEFELESNKEETT